MAQAEKILLRLTKSSPKISTIIDATNAFNNNNAFYQDLSGWDKVVLQIINSDSQIFFSTTNDNGYVLGEVMPSPEVPINWVSVLGVNLSNYLDASFINGIGIVRFGIIGKYLKLSGYPLNWYLYDIYSNANVNGSITFPIHVNNSGSLNPNLVGTCNNEQCVQLYINVIDSNENDRSDLITQLIGNETNLTLIQGNNVVTYHSTSEAFNINNNNVFYDTVYGNSPLGSLTVISPSANQFNTMDEIKIFITQLNTTTTTTTTTAGPTVSAYSYVISGIDLALATGNTDTNLNGKVYALTADDGTGNPASRTFNSAGGYNHWLCSMNPIIPTFGYYAANIFVTSGLISTQTNIGPC